MLSREAAPEPASDSSSKEQTPQMADAALSGIKVVDLSEGISGPYCTKMLASFGAEVIKVEKPEGDVSRTAGPFPGDAPHPEKSGLFLYLNTGKKSITLDLRTNSGTEILKRLVAGADVLVENYAPGRMKALGLEYGKLARLNPRLVMTSITWFGQSGPYRDFKATSMTEYALSGHQYINGEPDREPLQGAGPQPEYQGGTHGFLGTMMALYSREDTGKGQWVDVSIQECMAGFHQFTITRYTYGGLIKQRAGNRYESDHPISIYPCKDGYVAISASSRPQQEQLYTLIGRPELIQDERFLTPQDRINNADVFDEMLVPWLKDKTRQELFHTLSEWRIPCAPVSEPEDLVKDEHYKVRGFFVEINHPVAGTLTYPGAPFKMSLTPWAAGRAPLLGENNEEVYGKLGIDRGEMVRLRERGVI
jgi:crotonobetainyl-CoA:carnitine CoA-transferase CaiB-like acyl-CoA transferase